jgi:MFS family permease
MSAMFNSATPGRSHRTLRQAWWSLLLFPVSFVVAFVVGEGIPAWLGYPEPSLDSTPWWVITAAVVPALLIFAAPFLVTAHFSRKAVAGRRAVRDRRRPDAQPPGCADLRRQQGPRGDARLSRASNEPGPSSGGVR